MNKLNEFLPEIMILTGAGVLFSTTMNSVIESGDILAISMILGLWIMGTGIVFLLVWDVPKYPFLNSIGQKVPFSVIAIGMVMVVIPLLIHAFNTNIGVGFTITAFIVMVVGMILALIRSINKRSN